MKTKVLQVLTNGKINLSPVLLLLILSFPHFASAQGEVCEWCQGPVFDPPGIVTAIELASFSAERKAGVVILTWETGSEVNNEGFNIYRAESLSGPFTRINPTLIPAEGSVSGVRYRFTDTGIKDGVTYYYRLEDINTSGIATAHNTIPVNPVHAIANAQTTSTTASTGSPSSGSYPTQPVSTETKSGVIASQDIISLIPVLETKPEVVTSLPEDSSTTSITLPSPQWGDGKGEGDSSSFVNQRLMNVSPVTPAGKTVVPSPAPDTPSSLSTSEPSSTSSTTITFAYMLEEPNGNKLSVAKESSPVTQGEGIKTLFRSYGTAGGVVLEWYSDEATYGFNIWRSEEKDGKYVQINDALISYMDVGEKHRERVSYAYTDKGVKKGKTYFYVLMKMASYKGEAVYFGPVHAIPQTILKTTMR